MKVSFGKLKITPLKGSKGVPMAGYTRKLPSQGKLDDIFARGVLIESENHEFNSEKNKNKNKKITKSKRILFISLDLLKIPLSIVKYIKRKIVSHPDFNIDNSNILIHAIHTHSAPDLTGEFYWPGGALNLFKGIMFGNNRNDKYIVYIVRKILKLVEILIKDLKKAKISKISRTIEKDIVINRRNPIKNSKKDLTLFVFKSLKNNKIFGIMANYGMHPTTLSFKNFKISADYPGRLCRRIESKSKNQIKAIFFTAAAGDLNPITTCGTDFESLQIDPKGEQKMYDQLGTYENTKNIGNFLGDIALELAESVSDTEYFDQISFNSKIKEIKVPFEDSQPYIYDWKIWIKNKLIICLKKWLLYPVIILNSSGNPPNFPGFSLNSKFSFLKMGFEIDVNTVIQHIEMELNSSDNPKITKKLSILGVPGEIFEKIEGKLKNYSPNKPGNTIIFQNSNDWIGYLFSIKEYIVEGGYEPFASTTPVGGRNVLREFRKFL